MDHRQNLRRLLDPEDPEKVTYQGLVDFKRSVVRALAPEATGILLDPEWGAAQSIADGSLPGSTGLIVAIEATGYEGETTARRSRVLGGWSVEKAKRMGASAAKLLVYYHPDATNAQEQERLVEEVGAQCRALDMALFLEPLSYPVDSRPLVGEARRRIVVETARRLSPLGCDVLKAEFPYDPDTRDPARWAEACTELDAASSTPWVLLSGGTDEATFEEQVRIACQAGASGVLAGRSVWAEASRLGPTERQAFLMSTGRQRLARLAALVNATALPWFERPGPIDTQSVPREGWYRNY
jgi:tagatose-1,6-bisphosphate aldolase